MGLLLVVNLTAGIVAGVLSAKADAAAREALEASGRATWTALTQARLTTFMSEANDLAFSLARGDSAESSAEFGDVMGADTEVRRSVSEADKQLRKTDVDALGREWQTVRLGVLQWVNAEAEEANAPLRVTLIDDRVRASVETGIERPADSAGLPASELRTQVRREAEALGSGRLRLIGRYADEQARTAQAAAERARQAAIALTLALLAASALTALAAALWLYRTIAGPLRDAKRIAERVTAGELSAKFPRHSDDEIGALVSAVEKMRDSVVGKISVMREMAGAVLVISDVLSGAAGKAQDAAKDGDGSGLSGSLGEIDKSSRLLGDLAGQMIED